jgi:hypothetical protein
MFIFRRHRNAPQDSKGQILIKAGSALFAIVKVAIIKGIITIIVIYIIYRVCKYTINKIIDLFYSGISEDDIEEFEVKKKMTIISIF